MIINPTLLTINQLFGSNNDEHVVPACRRRYSRHERQIWQLIDGISLAVETRFGHHPLATVHSVMAEQRATERGAIERASYVLGARMRQLTSGQTDLVGCRKCTDGTVSNTQASA